MVSPSSMGILTYGLSTAVTLLKNFNVGNPRRGRFPQNRLSSIWGFLTTLPKKYILSQPVRATDFFNFLLILGGQEEPEEEGYQTGHQVINKIGLVSHGRKKLVSRRRTLRGKIFVDAEAIFSQRKNYPDEK